VEIEFLLAGRVLNTVAIVCHCSGSRCGFEFLGLTPEERLQIAHAAVVAHQVTKFATVCQRSYLLGNG